MSKATPKLHMKHATAANMRVATPETELADAKALQSRPADVAICSEADADRAQTDLQYSQTHPVNVGQVTELAREDFDNVRGQYAESAKAAEKTLRQLT